jgi:uncharacterized protein (DUF2141 family)
MQRAKTRLDRRWAEGGPSVRAILFFASFGVATHAPQAGSEGALDNAPPSRPTYSLRVDIQTRSDSGDVFCALWSEPQGYPVDRKKAVHEGMSEAIDEGRTTIRLESIAPGPYALACFHDENANGRLDTNFVGIPSEGTGASNDARGFMGPPSYEDARFIISEDEPDQLSIEIDY